MLINIFHLKRGPNQICQIQNRVKVMTKLLTYHGRCVKGFESRDIALLLREHKKNYESQTNA